MTKNHRPQPEDGDKYFIALLPPLGSITDKLLALVENRASALDFRDQVLEWGRRNRTA